MKIGITGSLGCGASEVARYLESKGIPVVSGDECGHKALEMEPVKDKLVGRFGQSILDTQRRIDRKKLGEIVFGDRSALDDLNRIIHPFLLKILKNEAESRERAKGLVIVDAALIYEWQLHNYFDIMIVVTAPLKRRIERVMKRDDLTREQVLRRMKAQMPAEEKSEKADYVIENGGSLKDLHHRVEAIWNSITAAG